MVVSLMGLSEGWGKRRTPGVPTPWRGRTPEVESTSTLWHSAATRFARAGVPIVQTQKLLGHASIEMTARVYTHLDLRDLRSAMDAVTGRTRSSSSPRVASSEARDASQTACLGAF